MLTIQESKSIFISILIRRLGIQITNDYSVSKLLVQDHFTRLPLSRSVLVVMNTMPSVCLFSFAISQFVQLGHVSRNKGSCGAHVGNNFKQLRFSNDIYMDAYTLTVLYFIRCNTRTQVYIHPPVEFPSLSPRLCRLRISNRIKKNRV